MFLNFSTTGSLDKAVLESLATSTPVFTSNNAFEALLSPYGLYAPSIAGETAAAAIKKFLDRPDHPAVVATLRNRVAAEHALRNLVPKILQQLA
jgi:hypothetical protein